jgi:hypothetical protein
MRPVELGRQLWERLDALGPAPRAELLHVLMLPDFDRADRGGSLGCCKKPNAEQRARRSRAKRGGAYEASLSTRTLVMVCRSAGVGAEIRKTHPPPGGAKNR